MVATNSDRLRVLPLTPADIPAVSSFNHSAWTHGVGDAFKRDIFQPFAEDGPEAQAIYHKFYASELEHNSPVEHYLKVVDTKVGPGNEKGDRVIACGCWVVFEIDPWSDEAKSKPEGEAVNAKVEATWLDGKEEWAEQKRYCEYGLRHLVDSSGQVEGMRRGHFRKSYNSMHPSSHLWHNAMGRTTARRPLTEINKSDLHLLFADPSYHRTGAGSAIMRWGTSRADELGLPCFLFASEYASSQRFYHNHGFRDVAIACWNHDRKMFPTLPEARATMMYRPAKGEEGDTRMGRWLGEPLVEGDDGKKYLLA